MVKSVFNNLTKKARRIIPAIALSTIIGSAACAGKGPTDVGGGGGSGGGNPPSISLTTSLEQNTTNVNYDVTMKNMTSATLTATHDGTLDSSMTRTVGSGSGAYPGLTKGNYMIKGCGVGANSAVCDSSYVTVTNYLPIPDFSSLTTTVTAGSSMVWNLENILKKADTNSEDDPVPLDSARSLDANTTTSVNGDSITVAAPVTSSGQSKVEIKYGSQTGGFGTDTISVNVTALPYPTFSGQIQDNHSNLGELSLANFYADTVTDSTWLGQDTTDASGNYDVRIDSVFPRSSHIIIEATTLKDTARTFAKFVKVPATGASGIIIRPERLTYSPTTYTDYLNNTYIINKTIFRDFMKEMNTQFQTFHDEGVVIAKYNILGTGTIPDTAVTSDTLSLKDPSGGKCDLSSYLVPKVVVDDGTLTYAQRHYKLDSGKITPDNGWGVVHRGTINTTIWNGTGFTATSFESIIANIERDVFLHEVMGRGAFSIAPVGSATSIVYPATLMTQGGGGGITDAYLGPADCDAIEITQDSTYTSFGTGIFTDVYNEILEISFRKVPPNKKSKLTNLLN